MKISRTLPILIALLVPAAPTLAADEAAAPATPADTTNRECKSCPFAYGRSGTFDLGLGFISDDSFKFGEYTGRNEKGGYLIGGGEVLSRDKNGGYWNASATDLGLDSREVQAGIGRQGKYGFTFDYDELPHFISDSARTVFRGTGGDTLTLPPGWVRAGSTGGMTALVPNLQDVDLDTKRKRVGLGARFITDSNWEYAVKVRHETKEGTMRMGGAFLFTTSQLVMPVDYTTNQVDVSATYASARWQTRLAYYGSTFSNGNKSLTWQNPFTAVAAGADTGQLALPPDNEFHQITAALGYQFSKSTRASADVAFGRMTQNENFLAPTLNTTLAVSPLPRGSLDGRVDTLNADLRLLSNVSEKLRLSATYAYDDRNNKTPQATYQWVSTDAVLATPRTNLPYSFTNSALKLAADYRTAPRVKTSVGVDYDTHKRTFLEADKTNETSIWGKVVTHAHENVDLTFKLAHAARDISNYQLVPQIDPPENPLLRKYNMSDRRRNTAGLRTDITPSDNTTVGFGIDVSADDYPSSTIGLTSSDDVNISADASVNLSRHTSVQFFANHEQMTSKQAGSGSFATPDFTAKNQDSVYTAGIGVKRSALTKKLDVGADYSVTRARGEITVTSGSPMSFPDLTTRLGSLRFYGNYRLKKNLSLQGAYRYEHYRVEDWMLKDVGPATIANALTLGEVTPSYHVNVVTLFMRYQF